eukprot:CAMPEP_0116902342 /NCGR_PEP_ID=MMETSP0467-20121206/9965_1 /TAXON_ID=283647 /ORGANISM="Mesodinium pulex, Strain SPMC105" /LENGTH=87 /DNA_ID=CAMNT_0004576175 /DNA_START=410 /DNA_END=673 /DNA_ORIENTATION=+
MIYNDDILYDNIENKESEVEDLDKLMKNVDLQLDSDKPGVSKNEERMRVYQFLRNFIEGTIQDLVQNDNILVILNTNIKILYNLVNL